MIPEYVMLLVKPVVRPVRPKPFTVRPKAITFQESVELTGKSMGLFVLFTSTLNWWVYRRITKNIEDKNKKP